MKYCPTCQNAVTGRSDKIYCSATCKNAATYERLTSKEQFYLKVDCQLKTNRRILKKYNKSGFTTLRQQALIDDGFNPKFFTHYWKNNKGEVYLFCYEFGFLAIQQHHIKKYLLVTWQDYMDR